MSFLASRWAFILLILACSKPLHGQTLLRWKLASGQSLQLEFQQDMEMSTSLMNRDMSSSAKMGMVLQWHVVDVNPHGTADMQQSFQRLAIEMSAPGSELIRYDSDDGHASHGLAQHLDVSIRPLIGVQMKQRMDAQGRIVDTPVANPATGEQQPADAANSVQELISQDGLRTLLEQAATILPEHPVSPGDRWAAVSEFHSPAGKLNLKMVYTYAGSELRDDRQLQKITVDTQVEFANGPNERGLDVLVKEQQNQGVIFFDAARGRFVESDLTLRLTMETRSSEHTHIQQLNTRLQMRVSEPPREMARVPDSPPSGSLK